MTGAMARAAQGGPGRPAAARQQQQRRRRLGAPGRRPAAGPRPPRVLGLRARRRCARPPPAPAASAHPVQGPGSRSVRVRPQQGYW